MNEGKYRYSCAKCRNRVYLTPDEVKMHLMYKGFVQGYWFWISHGEIEHQQYDSKHSNSKTPEVGGSNHINNESYESYVNQMADMVDDAIMESQNVKEEESSTYREPFYNMVQVLQQPLYDGCSTHSELSTAVRLLNIKSDYNIPQNCFNEIVQIMKEMYPPNNCVPKNYGQTKKVVKDLGNNVVQVDCCRKGCMLFFKEDANLDACKFCEHSIWKMRRS